MPENTGVSGILPFLLATNWLHPLVGVACTGQTVKIVELPNTTYIGPNHLLEIDHIIPVSKGGRTAEENLQTLCWKCNRAKSDKIMV